MYRSSIFVFPALLSTLALSAGIASAKRSGAVRMINGRSAFRSVIYTDGSGGSHDRSVTPIRYAHEIVEKLKRFGIGQIVIFSSFRMQNERALQPFTI